MGIKDSLDVYYSPDVFPRFSLGDDSLIKILKQFEIDRSETYEDKRNFALLEMVVDEHGKVIPNSVIINGLKSKKLIYEILNCETLLSNWDSAFYKGKPVKSKVNLRIQIID